MLIVGFYLLCRSENGSVLLVGICCLGANTMDVGSALDWETVPKEWTFFAKTGNLV